MPPPSFDDGEDDDEDDKDGKEEKVSLQGLPPFDDFEDDDEDDEDDKEEKVSLQGACRLPPNLFHSIALSPGTHPAILPHAFGL